MALKNKNKISARLFTITVFLLAFSCFFSCRSQLSSNSKVQSSENGQKIRGRVYHYFFKTPIAGAKICLVGFCDNLITSDEQGFFELDTTSYFNNETAPFSKTAVFSTKLLIYTPDNSVSDATCLLQNLELSLNGFKINSFGALEFYLDPCGSITGKITATGLSKTTDVSLKIPETPFSIFSEANGNFTMYRVPAGDWILKVNRPNFDNAIEISASVKTQNTTTVGNVTLNPSSTYKASTASLTDASSAYRNQAQIEFTLSPNEEFNLYRGGSAAKIASNPFVPLTDTYTYIAEEEGQQDVIIQFSNSENNVTENITHTVYYDITAPAINTFQIQNTVKYTSSLKPTFAISANDTTSPIKKIELSKSADWSDKTIIDYQTSFTYEIANTSSAQHIYARVQDAAGNYSETKDLMVYYIAAINTITITLKDQTALVTAATKELTVKVEIEGEYPDSSFILTEQEPSAFTPAADSIFWKTTKPTAYRFGTDTEGSKRLYLYVKDPALNISSPISASIIYDKTAPTAPDIATTSKKIDVNTTSLSVTMNSTPSDPNFLDYVYQISIGTFTTTANSSDAGMSWSIDTAYQASNAPIALDFSASKYQRKWIKLQVKSRDSAYNLSSISTLYFYKASANTNYSGYQANYPNSGNVTELQTCFNEHTTFGDAFFPYYINPEDNTYAYTGLAAQTTSGSSTITISSTSGLQVGMKVKGNGIASGTTIALIPNSTSVQLSSAATLSATSTTVYFKQEDSSADSVWKCRNSISISASSASQNIWTKNSSKLYFGTSTSHSLSIAGIKTANINIQPYQTTTEIDTGFTIEIAGNYTATYLNLAYFTSLTLYYGVSSTNSTYKDFQKIAIRSTSTSSSTFEKNILKCRDQGHHSITEQYVGIARETGPSLNINLTDIKNCFRGIYDTTSASPRPSLLVYNSNIYFEQLYFKTGRPANTSSTNQIYLTDTTPSNTIASGYIVKGPNIASSSSISSISSNTLTLNNSFSPSWTSSCTISATAYTTCANIITYAAAQDTIDLGTFSSNGVLGIDTFTASGTSPDSITITLNNVYFGPKNGESVSPTLISSKAETGFGSAAYKQLNIRTSSNSQICNSSGTCYSSDSSLSIEGTNSLISGTGPE